MISKLIFALEVFQANFAMKLIFLFFLMLMGDVFMMGTIFVLLFEVLLYFLESFLF